MATTIDVIANDFARVTSDDSEVTDYLDSLDTIGITALGNAGNFGAVLLEEFRGGDYVVSKKAWEHLQTLGYGLNS